MGSDLATKSEARFVRSQEPEFCEVDGEAVVLSVQTGQYYGTNPVGTRIWELLENPRTCEDLCKLLTTEFEVEPELCRREVSAFLDELRREELVVISEPDREPAPSPD